MFEGLALLLYRAHLGADEVKCGGFDLLHLHTGAIQMPLVVHSLSGGEEGLGLRLTVASTVSLAPPDPPLQHLQTALILLPSPTRTHAHIPMTAPPPLLLNVVPPITLLSPHNVVRPLIRHN